MPTAITQNPASVCKIAFGSFSYTGYAPETIKMKAVGDIQHVFADGILLTSLTMNLGTQIQADLIILAAGNLAPPAKGSVVTITPPEGTATAYLVEDAEVTSSAGVAKLSLTGIKHAGATYA
jgi:hypothetical protein